jgi:hypothetical protein
MLSLRASGGCNLVATNQAEVSGANAGIQNTTLAPTEKAGESKLFHVYFLTPT